MRYITKNGVKVLVATSGALLVPAMAEANGLMDIATETFRPGGPGAVMFQFTLIGLVSWLLNYLLHAINKSAFADLVKVAALLACIGIIGGLAYNVLMTIAGIAGLR